MKRQIRSEAFALLIVMGLVTACSSSGQLVVTHVSDEPIAHDKTVALAVDPEVAEEDLEPIHREVADRVRAVLFGRLVSDRIFKSVVHAPDPADYSMDVKVKGARQVSTGARVMLGAMAGANNLKLDVSLRERATNILLKEFRVEGHSASHPFSSEASLDDAIREAIEQVVIGLR